MLGFLNHELLMLIMSYLHPEDMLEFRLTSSRYHDSLEVFAKLELVRNPGWIEVLPQRLHGVFNNTFTKYFSAACYWMDLPFTARTSVVELLCCKVDFPLCLPRNKQIALCGCVRCPLLNTRCCDRSHARSTPVSTENWTNSFRRKKKVRSRNAGGTFYYG